MFAKFDILGPYARREAVLAVVYKSNGLRIACHLHDGNDRTKRLLLHDLHIVADVNKQSRRYVAADRWQSDECGIRRSGILSSLCESVLNLCLDSLDGRVGYDGPNTCCFIGRISKFVSVERLLY